MIDYTHLAVIGSKALQNYSTWARPFIAPFKRETRDIVRFLERGKRLLLPIMNERREKTKADPSWEPPDDFLTWVAQSSKASAWDVSTQLESQMVIGLAAIHTT